MDSPLYGIKLFFADGTFDPEFYAISDRIWFFRDERSYYIVRIAFLFDLITFSSYSATACLFAVLSFVGGWMLYLTFYKKSPENYHLLALAVLFVPSVIFWGSGLMKDTVTLAFIGIATYEIDRLVTQRKLGLIHILLLIISLYSIFVIRKFLLQAYLPAVVLWIAALKYRSIESSMLRTLFLPFVMIIIVVLSYWSVVKIGEGDKRYALEQLGETSRITAYDIRYWTGKDAGSGYSLGELDGTLTGMIRLAPQAINVTLFRPYPWEIRNVLMIFSSVESAAMFFVTIYCLFKYWPRIRKNWKSPEVLFCLTFALVFAFGVGISTFNFGSLARYKIPLLPFYLTAFVLLCTPPKEQEQWTE